MSSLDLKKFSKAVVMQRSKTLIPLSHDHHHGLAIARLIRKGTPQQHRFEDSTEEKKERLAEFYYKELLVHFRIEEEILFPAVINYDKKLDKLINELIKEHLEIKELVESSFHEIAADNLLDRIGLYLQSHIRKEERQLFTLIQEKVPDEFLKKLEGKLKHDEGSD